MIRRLISLVFLIVVLTALLSLTGASQQLTPALTALLRLEDRQAASTVSTETLPTYTRKVAGKPWFQRYFTRLALSDGAGRSPHSRQITKWTKRRVRIDILNNGGAGTEKYVRRLVSRLNRMQSATRFELVDGSADITIEFLPHRTYARTIGNDSVGNCETRFYLGTPGLVSAAIKINAGALSSPEERRAVIIHELTHALGFKGHLDRPEDRTRSVLYYAASIDQWTQNDGAAIRIMYSSKIKNGMNAGSARKALRRISATKPGRER